MSEIYRGVTFRVIPQDKKQEQIMWQHVGATRFIYNWAIDQYEKMKQAGEFVTKYSLKDGITQLKKTETWLNKCSRDSMNNAAFNAYDAMQNFYERGLGYPTYKTRKNSSKRFKIRKDRFKLDIKKQSVYITNVGWMSISNGSFKSLYNILNIIEDRINLYCFHDNKYWYVSFSYNIKEMFENQEHPKLSGTIGVDLGIKTLAFCSDGESYKNLNYTHDFKKYEKKIKRLNRKLSRRYLNSKEKSNNTLKLEKELQKYYRKLTNKRMNHLHHISKDIVLKLPKKIVLEDLQIANMIKNKHLSKSLKDSSLYELKRMIIYKAEFYGIEIVLANAYFPSTQTCSSCGTIKTGEDKLKLSQRRYKCDCGLDIDRDLNAAINLMNYT